MGHKPGYFKFLGGLSLVGFIGSLIWWLIDTVTMAYISRGWTIWISLIVLVILLVFGPAEFLLFFGHADLLEKAFSEDDEEESDESNNNYESNARIKELQKELDTLKEEVRNLKTRVPLVMTFEGKDGEQTINGEIKIADSGFVINGIFHGFREVTDLVSIGRELRFTIDNIQYSIKFSTSSDAGEMYNKLRPQCNWSA